MLLQRLQQLEAVAGVVAGASALLQWQQQQHWPRVHKRWVPLMMTCCSVLLTQKVSCVVVVVCHTKGKKGVELQTLTCSVPALTLVVITRGWATLAD